MFSFFSNLVCIKLCTQKFKSISKQIIAFLRKERSLYYLNSMVYYSILYMCMCIVYVHVYHVYKICLLPNSCHSYKLLYFSCLLARYS